MANTYSQIIIHIVFAVKRRDHLIAPWWKDQLYNFFSSVMLQNECQPIAIGGISSHIHILCSISPSMRISDLVRNLKSYSSAMITRKRLCPYKFEWQRGYGVFSVSPGNIAAVKNYVNNQEQHHNGISFENELKQMCEKAYIEISPEYMLKEPT